MSRTTIWERVTAADTSVRAGTPLDRANASLGATWKWRSRNPSLLAAFPHGTDLTVWHALVEMDKREVASARDMVDHISRGPRVPGMDVETEVEVGYHDERGRERPVVRGRTRG